MPQNFRVEPAVKAMVFSVPSGQYCGYLPERPASFLMTYPRAESPSLSVARAWCLSSEKRNERQLGARPYQMPDQL
jgi:hypothetical protein